MRFWKLRTQRWEGMMSTSDYTVVLGPPPNTDYPVIVSATAPANPYKGMAWQDTTNKVLKVYSGTGWVIVTSGFGARQCAVEQARHDLLGDVFEQVLAFVVVLDEASG